MCLICNTLCRPNLSVCMLTMRGKWACCSSRLLSAVQLCHRVVDGLCGREPPSRDDYSTTWSSEEWRHLLRALTAVLRLAVGNNSSDEEVRLPPRAGADGQLRLCYDCVLSSSSTSWLCAGPGSAVSCGQRPCRGRAECAESQARGDPPCSAGLHQRHLLCCPAGL